MVYLSDTATWVIVSINIFMCVLLVPLILYNPKRFQDNREEIIISHRHPQLVTYVCIATCIACLTNLPVLCIVFGAPISFVNDISRATIMMRVANATSIFAHGIIWLCLCRFWLMFYDLNYANSTMNMQWKYYLDESLIKKDFFLKHRSSLGSFKYALKITIILWIIWAIAWSVFCQMQIPNIFYISLGLSCFYIFSTLFFIILYYKCPDILDIFYLRLEIKIMSITSLITMVVVLLTNILTAKFKEELGWIGKVMKINFIICFFVQFSFISTWWTLCVNRSERKKISKSYSRTNQVGNESIVLSELRNVLLDSDIFELFVQHLCREFASEVIISFVELYQFKSVIKKQYKLLNADIVTANATSFDFNSLDLNSNPSIPKSRIVYKSQMQYGENKIVSSLKIAHTLYEKYIKDMDSELSINLSGEMREMFINEMDDLELFIQNNKEIEPVKLYQLFDVVMEELCLALFLLYGRFNDTKIDDNVALIVLKRDEK